MLNSILIAAYLVFFAVLVWLAPRRGIYLTILLLPTYLVRFKIFQVPLTLLEGMILILFIGWLIRLGLDKKINLRAWQWLKNKLHPQTRSGAEINYNPIPAALRWPIVAWLIAATLALIISPQLQAAAGIWKAYFLEPLMFLLVFIFYIKDESSLKKVIAHLAILSLVIGAYALVQKLTGWNIPNPTWSLPEARRVTTFFGYPNANGLLLAPIAALLFASMWIKEKLSFKILNCLGFIAGLLTIIWANCEGGLVALLAGVLIILLVKKPTRLIAAGAIIIIAAIISLTPNIRSAVWQKITITDFSGQIRRAQWSETWQLLSDHPFQGGGLANYQNAIAPYHRAGITINGQWQPVEIFLYPHNLFLNFWTETGILSLISLFWLLLAVARLLCRLRHQNQSLPSEKKESGAILALGLTVGLITLIIHGLVDVPYFKNDLSVLFWLFVGMIIVLYNNTVIKKVT
jgi:O-antigen ligase